MNIRKSLVACLMITPGLALSPVDATASQLSSPQGVFDESGGTLAPEVYFPEQEQGDLYLATVIGGQTYYITEDSLTLDPTPYVVNQVYEGSVELPQWDSREFVPNNYSLLRGGYLLAPSWPFPGRFGQLLASESGALNNVKLSVQGESHVD